MKILVNTDSQIKGGVTLTQEAETIVQQALGRFRDRITRVEVYLSDENSSEKFGDADKRCVIEARLGGLRPITVSHQGSTLDQALSGGADKLEKTLKRTLGRKVSLFQRRARERAELIAAVPLLAHDVETDKQEDFKKVLRPLLGYLGNHARRELRIWEAGGGLYPGQVVLADVLDEVVTRGWLQFADRPQGMPVDLWFTKILDEIVEEQVHENERKEGLRYDQARDAHVQYVPQVDDQEWWAWLLGEDMTLTEDDQIPSRQRIWAEEFFEAEELLHRIHSLLGELPTTQRRAFVLHVLEAYDIFEVAMVQNRSEADVRADIKAARRHLREQLSAGALQSDDERSAEALTSSTQKA